MYIWLQCILFQFVFHPKLYTWTKIITWKWYYYCCCCFSFCWKIVRICKIVHRTVHFGRCLGCVWMDENCSRGTNKLKSWHFKKYFVCVCVDLCERLNGKSFCVKSFVRFVKQLWKFRYSSDERLQFSPDFLLHVYMC